MGSETSIRNNNHHSLIQWALSALDRRDKMKLLKMFSALSTGAVLLCTVPGSGSNSSESPLDYRCQTVLHLVDTSKTAAIYGSINNASFLADTNALVTVFVYHPDIAEFREFTHLQVPKNITGGDTEFSLCWLMPGEMYRITISDIDIPYTVRKLPLKEGQVLNLNGGNPI
jgi:hypothetical protein